jgi:hypothetical protein
MYVLPQAPEVKAARAARFLRNAIGNENWGVPVGGAILLVAAPEKEQARGHDASR